MDEGREESDLGDEVDDVEGMGEEWTLPRTMMLWLSMSLVVSKKCFSCLNFDVAACWDVMKIVG